MIVGFSSLMGLYRYRSFDERELTIESVRGVHDNLLTRLITVRFELLLLKKIKINLWIHLEQFRSSVYKRRSFVLKTEEIPNISDEYIVYVRISMASEVYLLRTYYHSTVGMCLPT